MADHSSTDLEKQLEEHGCIEVKAEVSDASTAPTSEPMDELSGEASDEVTETDEAAQSTAAAEESHAVEERSAPVAEDRSSPSATPAESPVDVWLDVASEVLEEDASEEDASASEPSPATTDADSTHDSQSDSQVALGQLQQAISAAYQREQTLSRQVAELTAALEARQTEVEQLQDKVTSLQTTQERLEQLQAELDEAKRYILRLTQPTSPSAPTRSPSPATPSKSIARRPAPRPVGPAKQLQGLPPMSTERVAQPTSSAPNSAALVRSPKGSPARSPLPPLQRQESDSQSSAETTSKPPKNNRSNSSELPKPKLSDSEIGWFD